MFSSDVKLKKTEENKKKTKRKQKENKKKSKRRTANRHRTSSCQPEPPKELCVGLRARHPELLVARGGIRGMMSTMSAGPSRGRSSCSQRSYRNLPPLPSSTMRGRSLYCLGCAQPGKYPTLGIVKILPTTKSSEKIQF